MIFIRHHETCSSKPNAAGKLTDECDCKTAKLDEEARTALQELLAKLAEDSLDADEESEYFALRLDDLAEQIAKDARSVRRTAKQADRETRQRAHAKKRRSA